MCKIITKFIDLFSDSQRQLLKQQHAKRDNEKDKTFSEYSPFYFIIILDIQAAVGSLVGPPFFKHAAKPVAQLAFSMKPEAFV